VISAANRVFKRRDHDSSSAATNIVRLLALDGANVVEVLEKQARGLDSKDWFYILEGLGAQHQWQVALEVFRWMQVQKWYKSDSGFYSKLITIMGKEGQLRLAMWLFGEMRKNGCRPDTSLYNSVIAAQVRSQDLGQGLEKAFKFFEEMKAKPRCQPNVVTYNILLRASAQLDQFERVQTLFKEMQSAGIAPDIYSYNGVIDAYGKSKQYIQMESVLRVMRAAHCKPDLVTYNTLLDAYGRVADFAKMEQVFKSMSGAKSKHKPHVRTYNSLMCNYARAGQVEQMEGSLSRMICAGFKPTVITYDILISGYGRAGLFDKMKDCFQQLLDAKIRPEVSTLNSMIAAYCDHKLYEEAEKLLKDARQFCVNPQASSYSILLRAYGKDGYSEEMEQLLESMEAANISPSRKVFMEVADVYGLSTNAIKSVTKQPIHKKAEFAADANYW